MYVCVILRTILIEKREFEPCPALVSEGGYGRSEAGANFVSDTIRYICLLGYPDIGLVGIKHVQQDRIVDASDETRLRTDQCNYRSTIVGHGLV